MYLELANSILITFIFTEVLLLQKQQFILPLDSWIERRHRILPLIMATITLGCSIMFFVNDWAPMFDPRPLSWMYAIATTVGMAKHAEHASASILLFVCGVGLLKGYLIQVERPFVSRFFGYFMMLALCIFALLSISDSTDGSSQGIGPGHGQPVHSVSAAKTLVVLSAFLVTGFADCRRRRAGRSGTSVSEFLDQVALVSAQMIPVLPFIAILWSTICFLAVSLLAKLAISPRLLNAIVYYGTFYGPFVTLYADTKKRCVLIQKCPRARVTCSTGGLPLFAAHRTKRVIVSEDAETLFY